jgi:hypothetical protein
VYQTRPVFVNMATVPNGAVGRDAWLRLRHDATYATSEAATTMGAS